MVRQRLSDWSHRQSAQENACALLALGLVPEKHRVPDASASEILDAVRELLATGEIPLHWRLNAGHGKTEGWETIVPPEDLCAVVQEAGPRVRPVEIECGDLLEPEDVLYFFEREHDSAELRAKGWSFEQPCTLSMRTEAKAAAKASHAAK